MTQERILKRAEVIEITGLSHTTIFQKMKEGTFPKSVAITANRTGWRLSDVNKWMQDLPHTDAVLEG